MKPGVVDLLRNFIAQQATLGGPYDNAEAFYAAMDEFLKHPGARRTIADAWLSKQIAIGLDEVEAAAPWSEIEKRMEAQRQVIVRRQFARIRDERHARQVLAKWLHDIREIVGTTSYKTFSARPELQALVERAIYVIPRLLRLLPIEEVAGLSRKQVTDLKLFDMSLDEIGKPISRRQLWQVVTVIVPSIGKDLKKVRRRAVS